MAAGDNGADVERIRRQIGDLSLAHQEQFFAQMVRLKESAERGMYLLRERLIDVAVALCPAWVDALSENDPWGGIRRLSVDQIADGIITQVRRRIMTLEWRALPETEQEVAALRREIAALRAERARLLDRAAQLELETARLAASAATQPAGAPAVDADPGPVAAPPVVSAAPVSVSPASPDAARPCGRGSPETPEPAARPPAWTPAADSAAGALLRLIAEGESRRPRLRAALAAALGLSNDTKSVRAAFRALEEAGLAERVDVALPGNPALYLPTDAGLAAYRARYGAPPAVTPARTLLARHRTPAHTYLNLETADLLRTLGYTVDPIPPEARDERGHFVPDLLAVSPAGERLYVEVETGDGHHSVAQAARKWRVIADHTGGVLRAVCAHDAALAGVRAAVEYLAGADCSQSAYSGRIDAAAGVLDAMAKGAGPGVNLDDLWAWRKTFNAEKERPA